MEQREDSDGEVSDDACLGGSMLFDDVDEASDAGSDAHEVESNPPGDEPLSPAHALPPRFLHRGSSLLPASQSDEVRTQVGSILRMLASKYSSTDTFAVSSVPAAEPPPPDTLPPSASLGKPPEESLGRPPRQPPRAASVEPGAENAEGVDSMQAYAKWLQAELAADEAEDEPLGAQAGGDEAVEFTQVGGFNPVTMLTAAPLGVHDIGHAPLVPKRRPAVRRKSAAGGGTASSRPGGGGASLLPARVNVAIRCAVLVGKEVWVVARDSGSLMIYNAASAAHAQTVLCLHHLILTMASVVARSKRTVWCGTDAGAMLLYDAAARTCIKEITRQHAGSVQCIAVPRAPGGGVGSSGASTALVVSGGSDRRLCVWDGSGTLKRAYQGHAGAVRCVLLLGAHIWSGSDDATVRVWDLAHSFFHLAQSEACVATLRHEHTGAVRALLATGPGVVLSASEDGSVCKWQGAPHFTCLLRASCAGVPTSLMLMGRMVWVCCGRAGVEVRDALSLELRQTLRAKEAHANEAAGELRGSGAVGALRVHAIERRVAWSWVPGEQHGVVWEREESESSLSVEEFAEALADSHAIRQTLDAQFERLATLRSRTRSEALRALAVKATLAHELEQSLGLSVAKGREVDALQSQFMARQATDLDELRQLQRLSETLEAANRRQQAAHAHALGEAAEREAELKRQVFELRLDREALRAEVDESRHALSAAYCERDLLRLQSSTLRLELNETRRSEANGEGESSVSAFMALATSTAGSSAMTGRGGGGCASEPSSHEPTPRGPGSGAPSFRAMSSDLLGAESLRSRTIAEMLDE